MPKIVAFISKGVFQSALVAGLLGALSVIFVPFSFFSAGVVAFVSMRRGFYDGMIAAVSAGVIIAVLDIFIPSRLGLSVPVVFVLYPPVLLCAWILRITQSQGLMVFSAGLVVALFVGAMYLFTPDVVTFWKNWLGVAVNSVEGATMEGFELDGTLQIMNGIVATVYTFCLVFSLLIGRYLQSKAYNPGGFQAEFSALRIPFLGLAFVLGLIGLSAMSNQKTMVDLLMVFSGVFFFQGLAVFHGVVGRRRMGAAWLLPPYAGLLLMPRFIIVGLATLGVLDVFVDFRSRSKADR